MDSLQRDDKEPILISWINEYAYCPRRFYLKVLEHQQAENIYMTEGSIEHESVHTPKIVKRGAQIIVTGLSVYQEKLNLYGICDSIECTASAYGAYIPFLKGKYRICPIEYKHGKVKDSSESNLQLTAQAMCIESMYQTKIDSGYVYYYDSKERFPVEFTPERRREICSLVDQISEELTTCKVLPPRYLKRCSKCSVFAICNPKNKSIHSYISKLWDSVNS